MFTSRAAAILSDPNWLFATRKFLPEPVFGRLVTNRARKRNPESFSALEDRIKLLLAMEEQAVHVLRVVRSIKESGRCVEQTDKATELLHVD